MRNVTPIRTTTTAAIALSVTWQWLGQMLSSNFETESYFQSMTVSETNVTLKMCFQYYSFEGQTHLEEQKKMTHLE
jgi:hypothetical protein